MKASAIANANIALVKYWGKRDNKLILPYNSSISMTTDSLNSHTTIEFDEKYKEDSLILNGNRYGESSEEYKYVGLFLDFARRRADVNLNAKIISKNNFPTAAGLASSASGFAALAIAVNKALDLGLDEKQLSMLARRGSGSAARSICGGFVEWKRGYLDNGSDSYAEQIEKPESWPEFRMVACITSKEVKKRKSRESMAQTVLTSPMYKCWLDSIDEDIRRMRKGILEKNFSLVGTIAEENCLKMYATMLTAKPAIIYWNSQTMAIIHSVLEWRESGLECYFTMDAGPQVKIICLEKNIDELTKGLEELNNIESVIVTKPGDDAGVINDHLF